MAVLTPPFALGAAGQVLSGRLLRHNMAALALPGAGVAARSGVLVGPAGTMGELALPTALQLTVQAFHAVIQNTQDLTAGAYLVTNDAAVTLAVTAQHATQFRRSAVVIEVNDSQTAGVASSATTDRARLYMLDGALAATAGAAVLPATPANALLLGEVLIPPTGQTVTLTPYDVRTVPRGGRLPVATEAAAAALPTALLYSGFEVVADDTAARGVWDGTRFVWFDTRWQSYTPLVFIGNAGGGSTWGTGSAVGRYFRKGREVTVDGEMIIGSTTSFNSGAGVIYVGFPSGVAPANWMTGVNVSPPVGNVWVSNGAGAFGFCAIALGGNVAANRRFAFYNAAGTSMTSATGTAGSWNFWTVGHQLRFQATYETAYEA